MKKNLIIVFMVTALMLGLISAASAVTEMEILVDKLVEKGILTPADGDKIIRERAYLYGQSHGWDCRGYRASEQKMGHWCTMAPRTALRK